MPATVGKVTWGEVGGAVGDLGTFVPLLVGLAVTHRLDVGSTLAFTGIYNIVTGLLFDIPMPVQPMKTIAAVSLADPHALSLTQILVAGVLVSATVLVLGATGLIVVADTLVPRPVVRGVQMGTGLGLASKGFLMAFYDDHEPQHLRPLLGVDSLMVAIAAAAFLLLSLRRTVLRHESSCDPPTAAAPFPAALVLVLVGVVMALCRDPAAAHELRLGPAVPEVPRIRSSDWLPALTRAALPQLPLTVLNSVVAVCALSEELFPQRAASTRAVSISVGCMNLVGCWFGAMPVCHGSGGLAAQQLFGANSGAAVIMLGASKLALSLLFGASLLPLLASFPRCILGAMLALAGTELAAECRREGTHRGALLMLLTAGAGMAAANIGVGFVVGMSVAMLLDAGEWWKRLRTCWGCGRPHVEHERAEEMLLQVHADHASSLS